MTRRTLAEKTKDFQRQVILNAAARLFVEKGPKAVTIRKIAQTAKSSSSVIYTLFENKKGIIEALFIDAYMRFRERVLALEKTDNNFDFLLAVSGLLWDYSLEHPYYYRLIHGAAFPEFLPVYMKREEPEPRPRELVNAAIEALKKDGMFQGMDTPHVTLSMYSMITGLINARISGLYPEVDLTKELFLNLMERALRGISDQPQKQST